MPRIPVRVEPYSSPTKQHRHYKSKRDQVLRALGKAAYINGSQFALLLVSARGDVETYASEALQSRLDPWFVKSGIAQEARELARETRAKQVQGGCPTDDDTRRDSVDDVPLESTSGMHVPDDPFLDSLGGIGAGSSKASESQEWPQVHKDVLPDDSAVAYESASVSELCSPQVPPAPRMSTPLHTSATRASSAQPRPVAAPGGHARHVIELKDEASRTAFLELRFSQLQQVMCKMIAKEWIKVIEPKKQTRFPYNKGEAGRPGWWPPDVRHKEPDHLMKPERHALLLAILRSPQARIARLQLATAEVVALIKAGKVSYLMDIYRVGKEEERLRAEGLDTNTPVTVEVSSLDGWDVPASETSSTADTTPYTIDRDLGSTSRRISRADEEETVDMSVSTAWTPTGTDSFSPRPPMGSELPSQGLSLQTHDLNLNMRMQAMDVPHSAMGHSPFNQAADLPVLSPAPMRPEPTRSQTIHTTGALPVPLFPSPTAHDAPSLSMTYHGGAQDMQRSASLSAHPGSVSMRPTRSTPAHMPYTPDHWHLRTPQHGVQPIQVDGQMGDPSLSMDGQRIPMMMHPTFSGYQRPPPPAAWGLPETPLHRSHSVVPMGLGISMSPASGDIRLSSSFDSSFSSSHQGPVTPASMPPGMALPPGHAYPDVIASRGPTSFPDGAVNIPTLSTKQSEHNDLPFHPSEWQSH